MTVSSTLLRLPIENSDLPSEASYDHAAERTATFADCFADHLVR